MRPLSLFSRPFPLAFHGHGLSLSVGFFSGFFFAEKGRVSFKMPPYFGGGGEVAYIIFNELVVKFKLPDDGSFAIFIHRSTIQRRLQCCPFNSELCGFRWFMA